MEKDLKFTTAANWMNKSFSYDDTSTLLENFQCWWDLNSLEQLEFNQEPYSYELALEKFCDLYGNKFGITPQMIVNEYKKVVDFSV